MTTLRSLAVLALVLTGAACASAPSHRVLPMRAKEAISLKAEDVARILVWSGFTGEEALLLGPGLHDALALQGGAQIVLNKKTEALYAAHPPCVHVSSVRRGSFVYELGPLVECALPDTP